MNRLATETSPYLLQHAHNPVDWYPWGPEAFAAARAQDRPILLSVGYSACHWCHVMERESFEDDETAALMNALFVNVKVDREERPDVDAIYMQAVQAMTGHGGWPMTVFLTPDLEPYWGGTYFPPEDRHGMPSFRRVLRAMADAYRERRADVQRVAESMRAMYATSMRRARASGQITGDLLARSAQGLLDAYDPRDGGFGDAPKFPQPMALEFLLLHWARTGDAAALDAVHQTFLHMARGGIYDQIGGGFARYAVDAAWLVPHFEKMLYDNALLARLALHVWQATGDDEVLRVCRETVDWAAREMRAGDGGFWSALDADSEGEEGRFYLWGLDEFERALGPDAAAAARYWGVTAEGNFEGRNILHVARPGPRPAEVERARARLYDVRSARAWPGRDDKVLAFWNGLMLRTVAETARSLDDAGYAALALECGEFLFREMVRDGRVLRSYREGSARIPGFLTDTAAVGLGALALYELTFDSRWLDRAQQLANNTVRWFWDESTEAFHDTAADQEQALTRPRDVTDNATPAGPSLAAELLLRLGYLTDDATLTRRGTFVLESVAEPMARHPLAFGHALTVADFVAYGPVEVALVGPRDGAARDAMRRVIGRRFVPSLVLAGGSPDEGRVALLAERPAVAGRATAYVCRDQVCSAPITEPAALDTALAPTTRRGTNP